MNTHSSRTKRALFLQVTEPGAYPPIINASHILAQTGWQVDVLSAPLANHCMRIQASARLRLHEIPLRPDFRIRPIDYGRYLLATARLARGQLDLVYASDPAAALPGLLAARISGARLVYHEHDSPTHPEHLNRIVRYCRQRIFKRADDIVFPNARRGEYVQAQSHFDPAKMLTIWNTPRTQESVENVASETGPLVVYYHGSINSERLPMRVAAVVARFGGAVKIRVAGYESPGARGYMKEFVRCAGFAEYLGEVEERSALFDMAKGAHVGLCFMPMRSSDINMQAMTGASNKVFDYMAAGMNVLVSALPDWQQMFVEPGFARSCNPEHEEELSQALNWYLQHRSALADIGANNRLKITQLWNYEHCFGALTDRL